MIMDVSGLKRASATPLSKCSLLLQQFSPPSLSQCTVGVVAVHASVRMLIRNAHSLHVELMLS